MAIQKGPYINLLNGKVSFKNEPHWYKLIVIIVMAAFLLLVLWILKGWAIPTMAAKGLSGLNLNDILKTIRRKSP